MFQRIITLKKSLKVRRIKKEKNKSQKNKYRIYNILSTRIRREENNDWKRRKWKKKVVEVKQGISEQSDFLSVYQTSYSKGRIISASYLCMSVAGIPGF